MPTAPEKVQVYSEDGESYKNIHFFWPRRTDEEIKASFDYPDGYGCSHEGDCCGCWYPGPVIIDTVEIGFEKFKVASQTWSINV